MHQMSLNHNLIAGDPLLSQCPISLGDTNGLLSPTVGMHHLAPLYSDEYIASCECISSSDQVDHQVNGGSKKRKMSESSKGSSGNGSNGVLNGGMHGIKQENGGSSTAMSPDQSSSSIHTVSGMIPAGDEEYFGDYGDGQGGVYMDAAYQCIKFQQFNQTTWCTLCDASLKEL